MHRLTREFSTRRYPDLVRFPYVLTVLWRYFGFKLDTGFPTLGGGDTISFACMTFVRILNTTSALLFLPFLLSIHYGFPISAGRTSLLWQHFSTFTTARLRLHFTVN